MAAGSEPDAARMPEAGAPLPPPAGEPAPVQLAPPLPGSGTEPDVEAGLRASPSEEHPQAETPAQRLIARREQAEREFLEVKRVAVFYAAMLVPLLGLFAWVYHGRAEPVTAEYWGASIIYGVIAVFAWLWRHELQAKFVWPQSLQPRVLTVLILAPLATVSLAIALTTAVRALGWPVEADEMLEEDWPLWFCYLWVAALPAVFEEVAFRGILFEKLKRLMGPLQAGWVSAIMFGVVHFDVIGLAAFLVPLALVAAWLTHRTGSLWPAVLIHFLHNAVVVTWVRFG